MQSISSFKRFMIDDAGAALVEYVLLVALVAVAVIGTLTAFGNSVQGIFTGLTTTIGGVQTSAGQGN